MVKFMYLVFTCMPGESYRRRLRSLLLYLCYVFRALINSFVCLLLSVKVIAQGVFHGANPGRLQYQQQPKLRLGGWMVGWLVS